MTSPGEPTQLVQLFKLHQSQIRNERLRNPSAKSAEKRAYAQRLTFDDTLDESRNASKMPRLNPSLQDLSGRRISENESTRLISDLEERNRSLETKLKELTAENAGNLAKQTKLETRLKQTELEMKKAKLEADQKVEKANRLCKIEMDKASELKFKLKRMEDRHNDEEEMNNENKRQSLDKVEVLENKVRKLRETRNKLEQQVDNLKSQVRGRVDIDPVTFTTKIQGYESMIGELRQQLDEYEEKNSKLTNKLEKNKQIVAEFQENKENLERSKLTIEKLECELAANRDAFIQRKAMSQKLDQFSQLEKENQSLKSLNDLHNQTQENVGLLREQIQTLTGERDRAIARAMDKDRLQADLEVARNELREWQDLVSNIASPEERRNLANLGVQTAREILTNVRSRELDLVASKLSIQSDLNEANALIEKGKEILANKDAELNKVKNEQGEQTKLVKKLQRKLLLVSKERDTSRAILDSVEKELTVSGSSWEQKRIEGLEKTLEEYKAMIDMLMEKEEGEKLAVSKPSSPSADHLAKIEELEKNKEALAAQVEQLEMKLEQRALKGDYNPDETKVIHLMDNPADLAIKKRQKDMEAIKAENVALKARVQLLEDGQTKDLTMMVGQKVEEGASSAEIEQLNEKLKSEEMKNQRIVELFSKTSKEFRKFVAQTTGYKVDRIKDAMYKMNPIYVEKDQYLLFSLSEEEGVQLLETEFSQGLAHLMKKHLEKHDSIPMFLASLTMELFKKSQDEDSDSEMEDDGGGEEEEEEEDEEMAGEGGEEGEEEEHEGDRDDRPESKESEDIICVDDDD